MENSFILEEAGCDFSKLQKMDKEGSSRQTKILTQKDIENLWFKNTYSFDEFDKIKIIGPVSTELCYHYLHTSSYKIVDISEAKFIEEDKEVRLDYITPDGPIYGTKTRIQHFDYLEMFVSDIMTEKIILPPNIKRKHMNRIKDNCSIKEVVVVDECPLFSMKDGDVYNKKGTTLVYCNKIES